MEVVYHYIEPKNEAEAKEQQRKIDAAFDLLFEEIFLNLKNQGFHSR